MKDSDTIKCLMDEYLEAHRDWKRLRRLQQTPERRDKIYALEMKKEAIKDKMRPVFKKCGLKLGP